jgi:hypothetical protein
MAVGLAEVCFVTNPAWVKDCQARRRALAEGGYLAMVMIAVEDGYLAMVMIVVEDGYLAMGMIVVEDGYLAMEMIVVEDGYLAMEMIVVGDDCHLLAVDPNYLLCLSRAQG